MKTHLANSRLSKKPSRKQHATRKRLTLALIALVALAFAGFPALRRAEFSRRAGAQKPTVAPAIKFDIVVNSTGDLPDANPNDGLCDDGTGGTGKCTLRAAIQVANAAAGDDVISFNIPTGDSGCSMGVCTINLGGALPDLSTNILITGPGADKVTVRYKIGPQSRIFKVTTTGAVTIAGMTISNGNATPDKGGGIQNFSAGTVNVTNCTLSGNFTSGSASSGGGIDNGSTGTVNVTNSTLSSNGAAVGGGISNSSTGTVIVSNSTLSGNSADNRGGGISNSSTGTVYVTNSTLSGNVGSGDSGGGISNSNNGTVNVTNSTFSNNSARVGGGISNSSTGTVNVTNSTLSGNSAAGIFTNGGGIYNNSSLNAKVNVKSTIIANNTTSSNDPDVSGNLTSQGFNLIGRSDGSNGFINGTNSDQVGPIASGLDPKLETDGTGKPLLKNNGGPTQTIALLFGSPAIDKGTSQLSPGLKLIADQRDTGFPRTFNDPAIPPAEGGDNTDIGAFEVQTAAPTLQFSSATYSVNENAGTATITVTRANDTSLAATVNYATSNGTATAGADYTATSGTLSFASGEISKSFPIPIINDSLNEPNETVNLTLSNVTGNAVLGTPSTAVLTIVDDDPLPGLSINDLSVAEGNSGTTNANFTVSLSAASGQTVTVNYATANGTATAGSDYVATSGTLTFTPGQTSKTIPVTVNGDTTNEPDETFFVDLSSPGNATITRSRGTGTITNDDAATTVQFSASNYPVGEGAGRVDLTVTRSGSTSGAASVGFATSDTAGALNCNVVGGVASSRCDYETNIATVKFAAGETSKTVSVFIIDDSYLEGPETFTVSLSNPTGAALASPATATVTITDNEIANGVNPIDTAGFFVRLHYLDFLNREPDSSGLQFWTNEITSCGSDQACIALKRINVSAAFYLSIEFQETGYLVERIYKTAYGDATGTSTFGGPHQLPVPVVRLSEFLPDTQQIGQGVVVLQTGWETALENNKQAFTAEFVQRSRLTTAFPTSMTPAQFVDALNANSGGAVSTAERNQLVSDLTTNAKTRAQVLRAVAEDPDLNKAEFNRAFVLMQFFGYLRRNPNDRQDSDYTGYDFWLGKLNQFNGNFVNAEMVKAFILSGEYRQRFGP